MTHPDPARSALLARARAGREMQRRGDTEVFVVAAAWADENLDPRPRVCTHGCATESWTGEDFNGRCVDGCIEDPEGLQDAFIPQVTWDAAASLGAAIGTSTTAASYLIRDALLVRHRLPRIWERVVAGEVEPRRVRMVAREIANRPRDVSDHLDEVLAPIVHKLGRPSLERYVDDAMLRLYPEEREAEQIEALDRRYARLDETTINHVGIVDFIIRGDWLDCSDFDATVGRIAAAIARQDVAEGRVPESLDVRRSRAVGILAHPMVAAAMLDDEHAPAASRKADLVIHLTLDNLEGREPVAYNATARRPELDQAVREWVGRPGTEINVQPVIDLADHDATTSYRIKRRTELRTDLVAVTCAFPHCTKPAERCDHDHIVPFNHCDPAAGGASCDCNIAPLCRHHHQLKTHGGWRYTPVETGVWLWADPYGQQFLRDRHGTRDVTLPGALGSPQTSGCRRQPTDQLLDQSA